MRVLSCPGAARAGWERAASSVHDRSRFCVGHYRNNAAELVLMRICTTRSWRVRASSRGHSAAFAALAPGGTERTDWRGDQLNVAFSCWRGLASLMKTRQRLYQRKVQGRASPLQRDVSPAVALNSRCYERFRSPRHGVVMVVLVVGGFPHGSDLERRRGCCRRCRRPVPHRNRGMPSVVERHRPRDGLWSRPPPARTELDGVRPGQHRS